jgi:Zn-dependent protease/predicted transcriptional regulator
MLGATWRLGRIAGVEIRIDSSWVFIALLITYSLYVRFTEAFPDLEVALGITLGVGFGLLFFASVLAHEMAHALVARARRIPVRGITLFMFGGATHAKVESRGPWDEFLISVVGPLSSVVLGGAFFLLGTLGRGLLGPPVSGGFRYLAFVNVALAVFNLLPGFPLDGGRVLRSLLWRIFGSLPRATRVAGAVGQAVGYLMIGAGAVFVFIGGLVTGIWFAFIGWFVAQAARASVRQLEVQRRLEGAEVRDVMETDLVTIPPSLTIREAVDPDLVTVPPSLTVRQAVDVYFTRSVRSVFPVQEDGETRGLLTLTAVKKLPKRQWDSRRVQEVMEPLGEQFTVEASDRMDGVLDRLQEGRTTRCLVMSDGQVVGILTAGDIARWLRRRQKLQA